MGEQRYKVILKIKPIEVMVDAKDEDEALEKALNVQISRSLMKPGVPMDIDEWIIRPVEMKTVSERQQELVEKTSKVNGKLERRANLWRSYLQSVVARDIQPYQPTAKNANDELIDRTEYSKLRESFRDHISTLDRAERGSFINTACDGCKTILFDASPSTTLMSNPPCFWADCIGCGKRYPLGLSLREYADPPETRNDQ